MLFVLWCLSFFHFLLSTFRMSSRVHSPPRKKKIKRRRFRNVTKNITQKKKESARRRLFIASNKSPRVLSIDRSMRRLETDNSLFSGRRRRRQSLVRFSFFLSFSFDGCALLLSRTCTYSHTRVVCHVDFIPRTTKNRSLNASRDCASSLNLT